MSGEGAREGDLSLLDRRSFARLAAAPLLLTGFGGAGWASVRAGLTRSERATAARDPASSFRGNWAHEHPAAPGLRVDGERLNRRLAELAEFGATPEGGTHRLAYSDDDLRAREWLHGQMEVAGLEVSVDPAGNLMGRRAGAEPARPPILFGSHIDSVPRGGRFDGQVGSMGALEVMATLAGAGHTTRHPLELVIWANEEGGKTGSRVWIGAVEPSELEIVTASGFTIAEGTRRIGGDPGRWGEARREPGSLAAYLELHIEQGAVMEAAAVDIGVVEGIVGIKRWNVTVDGFANHAGTTPMDQRRDAMVAAARIVQAVDDVARTTPGRQVATVGRIEVEPGAPNVIPGRVVLSLEIRDLEMEKIDAVFEEIRARAGELAAEGRASVEFEQFYESVAAPTDPRLRDVIEAEARALGLSTLRMPSGAGHDAQSVALLGPVGMIFVPSRDGISHSPLEHTDPAQITAGADVLLRSVLALDEGTR